MYDIIFVILTYNTIEVTCNCVQSIKRNLDTNNYHIIIIDNCSKNAIGECLAHKYCTDKNVSVHIMDKNMGFAKGNNYGISIARKMDAKFICCINNDTLLEQRDFYSKLNNIYRDEKPAVIGPEIILRDDKIYRNHKYLKTIEYYQKMIDGKRDVIQIIKGIALKVPFIYEVNKKIKNRTLDEQIDDVVLHGCCIIFTPKFFEKLEGFDDRTFLYAEEELLYISLKKNRLISRFSPDIKIRHLEDVSTDATIRNKKEKESFIYQHSKNSLQIVIEELKKNPELLSNKNKKCL